jgi:hypothetical protein
VKELSDKGDEDAKSIMRQLGNYVKFTPSQPGASGSPAPKDAAPPK